MKPYIQEVRQNREKELLKKANAVSVATGYKKVEGKKTKELCIVVGVRKKLPKSSLLKKEIIPQTLDDLPVDVIEMGNIRALGGLDGIRNREVDPTQKHRPIMPGISAGHYLITSGTLGCFAKKAGQEAMLSNCHVFANSNDAEIGDAIYQPGPYDSGTSEDTVGKLLDFVPIRFGLDPINPPCSIFNFIAKSINKVASLLGRKHRLAVVNAEALYNEVDAAVATVETTFSKAIPVIGDIRGLEDPELDMEVRKFGRTTCYTEGEIEQVDATVQVGYDATGTNIAVFTNQIILGPMSAGGDSGSAIVNKNNNLVGLLFAGSDQVTIASPMKRVFELLSLTL